MKSLVKACHLGHGVMMAFHFLFENANNFRKLILTVVYGIFEYTASTVFQNFLFFVRLSCED